MQKYLFLNFKISSKKIENFDFFAVVFLFIYVFLFSILITFGDKWQMLSIMPKFLFFNAIV